MENFIYCGVWYGLRIRNFYKIAAKTQKILMLAKKDYLYKWSLQWAEAATAGVLKKKVFLEIS